jgi:hypothetical protein
MPIKACDYSMRIDNLKIIKANITQILKREISRINIPQVDKRKIWKAYHEKKIKSTLWTKFQQHFMRKKFNSSSRKIIEDHFVDKNSKTSNEQKVSNTHFQKFNCNLWRNNWTSWTSKKIMSPLCLLNFLHVVLIVNLKHATQPFQNREGEKLKQILLGFIIGHLIGCILISFWEYIKV